MMVLTLQFIMLKQVQYDQHQHFKQLRNLLDRWILLIIRAQDIQKVLQKRKKQIDIFIYKPYIIIFQKMLEHEQLSGNINYGKIYPLRWGYYSNPQMCMFTFTLILTTVLSMVMILNVFNGIYHKIIGTLLCIYVTYRFVSLGLSNPGLAVQSYDEQFQNQLQTNNEFNNNFQELGQETNRQVINQDGQQMIQSRPIQHFNRSRFYSFCQQCKIPTKRNTKHCKICKTCIDGFDHHCIWIGKCVGKKNMWQFKEFLCFVFVTLIYGLILSIQMSKIQRISK